MGSILNGQNRLACTTVLEYPHALEMICELQYELIKYLICHHLICLLKILGGF